MRDLWLSTVRTRGLRPVPLAAAAGAFAGGLLISILNESITLLPIVCALHALLVASGIVGQDVTDGVVQLLLARPVTRAQYLGGRLLGALTLSLAFGVALLAAASMATGKHDGLLAVGAAALSASLWTVVVTFFFSTFLPGRADTLGVLGLFLVAAILNGSRSHIASEAAVAAIQALWDNVFCIVIAGDSLLDAASLTDLVRWASNMLLAVAAGVAVFNHRQFGYAD